MTVPELGVYALEAIQVQEHEDRQVAVAVRAGDRLRQPVLEQRPVGEPSEAVVLLQVGQALFGVLTLDGVADRARYDLAVFLPLLTR